LTWQKVIFTITLVKNYSRSAIVAWEGVTPQPPLTLPGEHVLLLWQVNARAKELLAAAAGGRWPSAELAALTGYA
jgi:hypothetical protein